jgi:hypothetical protein
MRYTRRFVLVSMGCASGLSLMLQPKAALAAGQSLDPITVKLQSLVSDPVGARAIGRLYRRQFPAEDSPGILTHLTLSSLLADAPEVAALDRNGLLRRLHECVRADFTTAVTVQLDGWVLSRTEARLCALCG